MKAFPIQRRWCAFLAVAVLAGAVIGGGLLFRLVRFSATVLPDESLVVRGTVRQYRLVIPPSLNDQMPAPVLFVFHGAIDTTRQAADYTQLDRLAASQGVYVVYPQGRFLNWPPSIPPENPECIEPDLAFFDALCRELALRYHVDTKRAYVTGMSQGAAFVNLLVAKRSEKIAAAASHSGWLPDPLGDSPIRTRHKCPMLFIAGSEDRQVPPAAVREAYECFRREGHPVEFLMIEGLGHRWALDRDINAKIWGFLSPHRLLD
jgi:poly(3-hydroxybutyrate) depolymerase